MVVGHPCYQTRRGAMGNGVVWYFRAWRDGQGRAELRRCAFGGRFLGEAWLLVTLRCGWEGVCLCGAQWCGLDGMDGLEIVVLLKWMRIMSQVSRAVSLLAVPCLGAIPEKLRVRD